MAWLALSGTRARINQSLCLRDNLGDVSAKAGSQSTAAGLVGTGIGILISAWLKPDVQMLFALYFPLGALNLYSVVRSNYSVSIHSLNVERLERVLYRYFKQGRKGTLNVFDVSHLL
jgi:hypothetical protein